MGETADIAVVGGTGFYDLFADSVVASCEVMTPFGAPSAPLAIGDVAGRHVAFLPRHGSGHSLPPHQINYRANIWALQSIGVQRIVAPCAVGSLRAAIAPGHVVVCDQYIDRTRGARADTFFDAPSVAHLSAPDPYCDELRLAAATACGGAGLDVHDRGTVVVIDGPRFATRAESRIHREHADIINMTQYPEVTLARELNLCYAAVALVTDYDTGHDGDPSIAPVTQEEAMRVFAANSEKLRAALLAMIASLTPDRGCGCAASQPELISH